MKPAAFTLLLRIVVPVVCVALWWVATLDGGSLFVPTPMRVWVRFRTDWLTASASANVLPSVTRLVSGFLAGVVVGVALGVPLGMSNKLRRTILPYVTLLRSVPGAAMVLIFLVVFGAGDFSKILLIAVASSFPVLLNTIDGVRECEPVLTDVATSYRFTQWQRMRCVFIPGAAPQIAAGIRTSIGLAFVVMVISEFVGGINGIGYFTHQAAGAYAIADMWAGMILLGFLGIGSNALIVLLEHHVLSWHRHLHLQEVKATRR